MKRCARALVLAVLLLATGHAEADLTTALRAYQQGDHLLALWEWLFLAHGGDARAQFNLAGLYYNGVDVAGPDYGRAAEWYRRAAEQDHDGAQFNLGLMHQTGRGVAADPARAAEWYARAAARGHARAQYHLAALYQKGLGGTPDLVEAARWYARAAEQGYVAAQVQLALMYDDGHGVARDLVQAYKWYTLAAERLSGPQRQDVTTLLDAIRPRLSSAELTRAQGLIDGWHPAAEAAADPAPVWPRELELAPRTGPTP
jgi:TPR repeat protein